MDALTCRVCDSTKVAQWFEVRGSTLDRCDTCEFVQVRDHPPAGTLEAIYESAYFDKGKYDNGFAQRRENQRRLALMTRAGVAQGSRVLDVGCGPGEFVEFASVQFDMWGLDISPAAIEQARRRCPRIAAQLVAGVVEDLHFDAGSFDAIAMWDVVEHLWDPRGACRRLVDLLRPGGRLILSTPDIGAATARLMGRRWAFMTPPEHLGFFNRSSLSVLLERELGLRTASSSARGKWSNLGFVAYKLGRVFGPAVPRPLVDGLQRSRIGRTALYVPTGDIRYVAASKPQA